MISSKRKIDNRIDDILSLKAKVFSFDVFDTVLTRITATPSGIFVLIQNKLKKQRSHHRFQATFVK